MGCESSTETYPTARNIQLPPTPKAMNLIAKFGQQIKNKQFSQIIKTCRAQIQKIINQEMDIDGMGNLEQATSYYQWNKFEWYIDGISKGEYIGTYYDLLSLCELELKNNDDELDLAMEWYRGMIDLYPQNYPILYGYANVLYSKGIYQEAIDFYNRVIEMKPKWTMPYECIAFIHQYKRIQIKKVNQIAEKLLKLQPNNRVAMFVLARNQKDTETKIQKLKEASLAHPRFARVINEIGIVYGGTKKEYKEAITWYKKCIEVAPLYASCYNNIGVNYELLQQYDEAISWYFQAVEKDKQYKAPHTNLTDCFETLNYTLEDMKDQMTKYNIQVDYFYYYLGLAYYDKKKNQMSKEFYMLAQQNANLLRKQLFKLYNSIGITYDQMKKYDQAIEYYTKCIQMNPKYHNAYYNAAIVYKAQNKLPQAIQWYKKAIQANHRYSYAYNNLGNIYKNEQNYEEAIGYYKKAVKNLSTYTLAYANLAVCYMKLQKFREAFNAISRAKELLPSDNNGLIQANKIFLNDTLALFDQYGQNWRQCGGINKEQRQKLNFLIESFQANFKSLYKQSIDFNRQKVFKREITQIIKLISQDKFQLQNIDLIYTQVKSAFKSNEEYFHIIPQIFLQYFINNTFKNNIPILQSENKLREIVKRLSVKTVQEQPQSIFSKKDFTKFKYQFKLKNFNPPSDCKVNLFKKQILFFQSYQQIYAEIMQVNKVALAAYKPFKTLVDQVRKQSYGTLYGVGMKIPKQEQKQFKVILRIFQKMFKKEMNSQSVQKIISKIEQKIQNMASIKKEIGFSDIVRDIMDAWTEQITAILNYRRQNLIQTTCEISDLLRGKLMFSSLDRLKKALQVTDELCFQNGYQIIQMEDRLAKPQTQDVVVKIKVKEAICEFQLALQQDETQYHFVHSIYEIERSPLGCIFGSYIYMSKHVNYHLIQNCKDILRWNKKENGDTVLEEAAQYIVDTIKST